METQLKKLERFFRLTRLTPDMFNGIEIQKTRINLWGEFNADIYNAYPKRKWKAVNTIIYTRIGNIDINFKVKEL